MRVECRCNQLIRESLFVSVYYLKLVRYLRLVKRGSFCPSFAFNVIYRDAAQRFKSNAQSLSQIVNPKMYAKCGTVITKLAESPSDTTVFNR